MTTDSDSILARAARELKDAPAEPRWLDISSSIISKVRSTTRRTWPVDGAFPTSPSARDADTLRISDLVVRTAILRSLQGVRGSQPTDISLYLDDHVCTGLSISVVGVYGSDLQAVGNELAGIAIGIVADVLGIALTRDEVDVRVDDIEV
ncbi:hypothetical protein QMK17_10055 [Rhodococcus sp. G-MC3]|uniref:hypothetical protein n=1 Tax=Rhodococcus sp. G-MC3 TaxID=3046209 RepID=UPI0024BAEF36|nr:hypothetical protein [Rhodococcus sp. G-MC3]MDJ0393672.1 hypothetical protein [Rhodococcus sp. G-MC3]